jgi:hypothetical protein
MQNGYSLHIGVNEIDSDHYEKKVSLLKACHNDAFAYQNIAHTNGYHYSKILLDSAATGANFYTEMELISKLAKSGDIFFLSFSGHGSQKETMDRLEKDGKDDTWCFYDGQILDNQLFEQWQKFEHGVRILVVSDSCHSGTILRDLFQTDLFSQNQTNFTNQVLSRSLESDPFTSPVKASISLLAAVDETRYAQNDGQHGLFTQAVLDVWNKGSFTGNYQDFYNAIAFKLPKRYPPAKMNLGSRNKDFNLQRPFQIHV